MAKKLGRPSKYKKEYDFQAERLSRLGATDKEMADFFEVSLSTLSLWKTEYESFSDALKEGKIWSDVKISESLFKKACGFSYMEEIGFKCKSYDEQGRQIEKVETKMVARFQPPDTTACIFWLKNRRTNEWRDKRDVEPTVDDQDKLISTLKDLFDK